MILHHCGDIGGAGISLLHIVRALDKTIYEVTVICPDEPNNMCELLAKEGCRVVKIKNIKIFPHYNGGIECAISIKTIKNIIGIYFSKNKIKREIQKYNPDIVAVNSMTLCWIGKIIKSLNKKSICFHRETYQRGIIGIRTRYIKQCLNKYFDEVIFISKYDFDNTPKKYGRKHIVYDRVDFKTSESSSHTDAKINLNIDEKYKYILYLGGFSELKGAHVILEALSMINNDELKLIFVGDINNFNKSSNKYNQRIKNIIEKYNLKAKIIFKEKSDQPELFYSASNLVVFPSTKAHQARPIYEAGIAKIPIIITDFKETQEFAINKETAITFRCEDSKDLAEKIKFTLSNDLEINKIVEKNYKITCARHNINTLIEINEIMNKI